ncbi:MAG: patatin-like phospholipase family protein [Gammaproteobacteria bacterium]|nr:patatin-like phospholipase family protein [Gammaproteobacteria bacterium]
MSEIDLSPVSLQTPSRDEPDLGIGLCLSGGGYRAMLFHLGVIWRLAELSYLGSSDKVGKHGPIGSLQRVSAVSGGSITAGLLGLSWGELRVDEAGLDQRFREFMVEPMQAFASKTTISIWTGLWAAIVSTTNKKVIKTYRERLYGRKTLQDLPDHPRFVFNATNLQSGALWRFSKPYSRDWRVGEIKNPTDLVAAVVGASSAFPPFLSPVRFKYSESQFTSDSGDGLQRPPFSTRPTLSDGGVYDNMGLETVFKNLKTVLVSNAGGGYLPKAKVPGNWVMQSYRVLNTIDNQVRNLRKRNLLAALVDKERFGAYWSIRGNISDYPATDKLDCPFERTQKLANIETDLAAKDHKTRRRLINWGYAICDAGIRSWVEDNLSAPDDFPYPAEGV